MTLVNRRPFRTIADRFRVSKTALLRHHDDHLPETLAQAKQAEETARAGDLMDQLVALKTRLLRVLDQAEQSDDYRGIAALHREMRGYLDLLGELMQALDRRPTINFLIAPEWIAARASLVDALRPFPEARAAVAARLLALETLA